MDQILNNEVVLNKKKNELGTVAEDSEGEYVQRLVEFVLNKIHERHKNTTHAFRFFDTKGKGKIKKIDLIEGMKTLKNFGITLMRKKKVNVLLMIFAPLVNRKI
jgi:Ca2+-binding EF-hand superfamily protein